MLFSPRSNIRRTANRVPIRVRSDKGSLARMHSRMDVILTLAAFALVVSGLVLIASAGVARSLSIYEEPYYYLTHQLLYGFVPGLAAWFIFQKMDYRIWQKWAFPFFIITIVLLLIVFIPGIGTTFKGAQRWINLGGLSFQPTELCKLSLIVYLAAWLSSSRQKAFASLNGFLGFVVILGILGVLIMKQPDMGTLGIITVIAFAMYFLSGARFSYLVLLVLGGLMAFWMLVHMAPYRVERLMTFLDPQSDPQGKSYQINQALIALGSGGPYGVGLGHGRQKFNYLPEPVGDSIFAILGEEMGLVGCTVLIALFVVLAWRGFLIAWRAPDMFGRLLAGGITSWFVFQAFINIAAITALIPLTGIPLPFISYGGSALIFAMAGVGILVNISKKALMSRSR
ncbi:MAG: putative lipid II flippase FtsW [Candidatus Moranbacteria bacterium]|nr:putative lipid II flippase FtsW [Candidatus Moranbacteria bacterium]